MAKLNTSSVSKNTFSGSINQEVSHFGMGESDYLSARNAINQSSKGDVGTRITEPSNILCTHAPFVIIGADNLEDDWWVIFSTNNTTSEIGFFRAKTCTYTKLARDTCMGFKTTNLITAVSRVTWDGSYNVYFDDHGLNVSRMFNTRNFPFIQDCTTVNNCITCVDTEAVDCNKLRLESFIKLPCVKLSQSSSLGSLANGTYQVFVAYMVNGQRVSDYCGRSNLLSIFSHENVNSSIQVDLSNLDTNFDEFELVIMPTVALKVVARSFGVYSTRQTRINIDSIDNDLPTIDLKQIPLITPVPDRSEGMFKLGNYLTRINPTNKLDFNYQPLANQIKMYWQSVEYPADYYKKGGTNVGHMRDEVYPFFIRFVWNTGDKSNSFHIPGRYRQPYTITNDAGGVGATLLENDPAPASLNVIEPPSYTPKVFEVYNTANLTATPNTVLPDGGVLIAEGEMGYHESTEIYEDDNSLVWNANIPGHPEWDLCGQPIRHHRFPDNILMIGGNAVNLTNHYKDGGNAIRVMGFRVENVQPPVDLDGNIITNIVGYEILRGSRNGEKTVLFKGMINNMYEYNIPESISNRTGLYANYPFNDLRADLFISKNTAPVTYEPGQGGLQNYEPNDRVSLRNFTFHSPDTTFEKPFLGGDEIKIYGPMYGLSRGYYLEPNGHPRHKFVTDLSFIGSIIVGFGYAIAKMNGNRDIEYPGYEMRSQAIFAGSSTSAGNFLSAAGIAATAGAGAGINGTISLQGTVDALTGQNDGFTSLVKNTKSTLITTGMTSAGIPSSGGVQKAVTYTYRDQNQVPGFVKLALAALGNPMFLGYMSDGANTFLELIKNVGSWRQHALQYQAYCGYENMGNPTGSNRRRSLKNARFLDPGVFEFESNYLVNHKLRNETVIFSTDTDVESITGGLSDVSRPPLASSISTDIFGVGQRRASSHYVAFKSTNRNQYGQLSQIVQLPASDCVIPIGSNSGVIFGGDTYVGRYSEKNTLYYFDQWLNGEPDGSIFNYFQHKMFEHVAFWMDSDPFDLMEFVNSVPQALGDAIAAGDVSTFFSNLVTPSDKHCFDRMPGNNGLFLLKKAYMYLFQSGVRDFFVESEYNVDYRDWEDDDAKKHWPVLSDLKKMFSLDLIKADNYYKFDKSLAVNYITQSRTNWGILQERNFDPIIAATVFQKRNRRLIYSLPQDTGAKKDNFSVFLPLNYKDFSSDITCVKPIGKTGGMIFFRTEPPGLLPGTEELKLDSNAKITIGDGSLFAREMQRLDSSELPYQHGSCQNKLAVVNTPIGIFYASVDQGEVFYTNGQSLKTISDSKLRKWFNRFLPYQLIKDFPSLEVLDNPVSGIGLQMAYMPDTGILYICKKDFRLRTDFSFQITYLGKNNFLVDGYLNVKLGDPRYFESASWTISWDVAGNNIISFNDWHPDLILPGPNVFHTTKINGIWKHNAVCNSFCNYYGVDYPFEITFNSDDKFNVSTLRSIEYYLEAFKYGENCYDRYHVLNFNFNKAIVFNSEQVSGILNLIHDNGLNPEFSLKYPKINFASIDILYSKEEQKYRFNQFWDIVKDRGEFSNTEELIWNTEANGYVQNLNPANLDYNKAQDQQKKFRHHNVQVRLIRENVGNVEMVVSLALLKKLNSSR